MEFWVATENGGISEPIIDLFEAYRVACKMSLELENQSECFRVENEDGDTVCIYYQGQKFYPYSDD